MIDSNFLLHAQKTTEHAIQTQINAEWVYVQTNIGKSIIDAAAKGNWSCSFMMDHKVNGEKAVKMLKDIGFTVYDRGNRTHPVVLQIYWNTPNDN